MRAIDSVRKQSFPVHEILICDDGSNDGSQEAVLALFVPMIKWIPCGKNGGPAIPRNVGIEKSTGNWIAFLDSDDIWYEKKLELQVAQIRKHGCKFVCTNADRIIEGKNHGAYLNFEGKTIDLVHLMRQNSVICSSVLVEKNLLLNTSLFPIEKHLVALEDFALWMRLATKNDLRYISEPLVGYNDNASVSIRSNLQVDSWTVYDLITKDFKSWLKKSKASLTTEQKKEFKALTIRVKYKGLPSPWQNFKNRIKRIFK